MHDLIKRYGYAAALTCGWLPKLFTAAAILTAMPVVNTIKNLVTLNDIPLESERLGVTVSLGVAALGWLGCAYGVGILNLEGKMDAEGPLNPGQIPDHPKPGLIRRVASRLHIVPK